MGRKSSKPRKHQPQASAKSPRPLRKLATAQEIFRRNDYTTFANTNSFVERPVPAYEAPLAKKAQKQSKVRETVSASVVFKKQPKPNLLDKKHRRSREVTLEPKLVLDFEDGLEIARAALHTGSKATFDDTHAAFTERLELTRSADMSFFEKIHQASTTLRLPLTDELVEISTSNHVKETVSLGKRVAQFKMSIEEDRTNLMDFWKQWDDVQNEYIELGIDVFGAAVFGEDVTSERRRQKGFKHEMELFDLKHGTRLEELQDEVGEIITNALQKMKTSEKELDTTAKREQARLLQALIQD